MRAIVHAMVISLALTVFAGVSMAQRAAAPTRTFMSAADVQALIAKAKADIKPGQTRNGGNMLHLDPYNLNMENREGIDTAAVHENEAEVFYVIEGSGVLTTGGKLKDEKRLNPTNLSGSGIEGGTDQPMAKGDWMIVPEGVPHWVSKINNGGSLVFMTFHVPRPIPGK